jgi:hypothetical protein
MAADLDHSAGGRILLPVEHHADDLIQGGDGREGNQRAEEPFESTHGTHDLS